MSTTAVKKTEETALVASLDYGADEGSGFEKMGSDHFSIPFMGVLQAMSPQVADPREGGIEGARPGMIINTVTGELYDGRNGIEFIPSYTEHVVVEWVPREKGGGFVAIHQVDSEVFRRAKETATAFGKYRTPEGNDLVETFYVYGVTCHGEDPGEMMLIAFTSTKIKIYKRFATTVGMFQTKTKDGRKVRPPLFAHRVRLTTVKEKNTKGDFYNFSITPAEGTVAASLLPPNDPRLEAARSFRELVMQGMARAAFDSQDAAGTSISGQDDEMPF